MSVHAQIEQKLLQAFSPDFLDVIDESHMHSTGPGAESHFKLILVTSEFAGQRLLARHRAVNKILADELKNKIHALAMHTYTPQEWNELYGDAPESPQCLGGSKKDPLLNA